MLKENFSGLIEVQKELRMSSKEIAELTGKRHDNVLRDCDELNERYEDLQLLKIEESFNIRQLPNGGSKKERVYLLTKMQTLDLITGYDASLRIMINRRWEELEKKERRVLLKEESLLLDIIMSDSQEEKALALKEYRELIVLPLKEDLDKANRVISHKTDVIAYMVDDVKLMTQRQFLNEIIRMKGNDNNLIRERWKLLYSFYEKQKNINLSLRFDTYNSIHKPKLKSKLQYIDEILRDIPTLYRVAVKTFEADFKDKLNKYIDAI